MAAADLKPAAQTLSDVIRSVPDEQLAAPTPCTESTVGDLIDHIEGFCFAFTAAARKEGLESGNQGPSADASRLGDDWRERIPAALDGLARAWSEPGAWDGMTRAGGMDMPGEVAGLVALDEVVVHGWDIASATGQQYAVDQATVEVLHGFVQGFAEPGAMREGLFGPVVPVPDDAPLFDRVLGLTGRDPGWSPG